MEFLIVLFDKPKVNLGQIAVRKTNKFITYSLLTRLTIWKKIRNHNDAGYACTTSNSPGIWATELSWWHICSTSPPYTRKCRNSVPLWREWREESRNSNGIEIGLETESRSEFEGWEKSELLRGNVKGNELINEFSLFIAKTIIIL